MHEIAARIRPRILDDLGLRDAVQSGTRADTRGEDNIWTVAMCEAT